MKARLENTTHTLIRTKDVFGYSMVQSMENQARQDWETTKTVVGSDIFPRLREVHELTADPDLADAIMSLTKERKSHYARLRENE